MYSALMHKCGMTPKWDKKKFVYNRLAEISPILSMLKKIAVNTGIILVKIFVLLTPNSRIATVISMNAKDEQKIERKIREERCSKIVGF